LATTAPLALRGLLRGQAWLAARRDPSFVVDQYTTEGSEPVPDDAAAVVRADFLEAFAASRRGAATEFRHAATDWGIPLGDVEAPVRFRHGERDTNVPLAGVRRLAARLPDARVRTFDDADHLHTLLRSVPDVLAAPPANGVPSN
jgi:pimeloyl-ACP methyl ester carboxylesterase